MTCTQSRPLTRRLAMTQLGLGGVAVLAARHATVVAAQAAASGTIPSLLAEWVAAWSSHDPEQLVALYAPDAVYEEIPTGSMVRGSDGIRAFVEESYAAFPDIVVSARSGFQAEGWAVLEGDFAAHSAEGRPISAPFAAVFELDGETIRRSADYFDMYTVLQQMGALPESAAATPAS
jgi:steroid delta-isomerase-like uncharacterized protein